jgi:Mn-dependent DtxR family transcriptional regulator
MISLAREALVHISKRADIHYTELADMMRISPYYAHLICRSLSKDEYIVMEETGKCKITPKGLNVEIRDISSEETDTTQCTTD